MRKPDRFSSSGMTRRRPIFPTMVFLLVGFLAVFALMLAFSEPLPYQAAPPAETMPVRLSPSASPTIQPQATQTATVIESTPTATPLPEEFLENREQTIGVIIGTFALVVIVLFGTLRGIWARKRE